MQKTTRRRRRQTWWAILFTGLVTSTFSTVIILLSAPRIGRNIALGWMEVATLLWRDRAVRVRPTAREFIGGVLIHQFADFAWAALFFGLGGRWTQQRRPAALLLLAPVWAVVTSAVEYYLILPWRQPLVRMQTPYWIGVGAHLASGAVYPLFPWLQHAAGARVEKRDLAFGRQ